MRIGIFLRNFGPASKPETIVRCAETAESLGLDDLWLSDHLAIPPEESEGSGGRYLDTLATLAFLAAVTKRIGIGTSVLIVPYRPALPTAKWLATIQELAGGRLTVGAAPGWMAGEFRAVGVDRRRRGAITDEALAFWHKCFSNDVVEANGQRFVFKPRPVRPRILIGGAAPQALQRAVRFGDGWLPAEGDPAKLRDPIATLARQMADAGKASPDVITLTVLPLDNPVAAVDRLIALAEAGVTGVNYAGRYETVDEFKTIAEKLLETRSRANLD